jgi:hypothetical protein
LSPDTGFSSASNVTAKKPKVFSGTSPPASSSEAHSPSSAPSTAAASTPTAEANLAAATLASSDASSTLAPVSSTPGAPIHAFGDTSFFPIGDALQSTISNLVDMGFEPDQVQRALRASYNNPDRAVEYLTTVRPLAIALPAHYRSGCFRRFLLTWMQKLLQYKSALPPLLPLHHLQALPHLINPRISSKYAFCDVISLTSPLSSSRQVLAPGSAPSARVHLETLNSSRFGKI